MGTFVGHYGTENIREEKTEFLERALKVLDEGGMMGIEPISMFGKEAPLDRFQNVQLLIWEAMQSQETGKNIAERLAKLLEIVKAPDIKARAAELGDSFVQFGEAASALTRELVLYFIAGIFKCDFWMLLRELYACHLPEENVFGRERGTLQPVEPVSTNELLRCSDDDRALWWTPEGSIKFSPAMEQWMQDLNQEYQTILRQPETLIQQRDFLRDLIEVLHAVETHFKRAIFFRDAFYELLRNIDSREAQACVLLMQALCERYNVSDADRHDLGTERLRRFYAIWANPALRERVFGVKFRG